MDWKGDPLLLLATARLDGRTTASFQWEGGPPHDRQKIQTGLRKGNTVLVHFRSGVVCHQCVLIMLDAELPKGRPRQGQHKYWRYVSPQRTYFAWLPETLARTYCSNALDAFGQIPYGEVGYLEPGTTDVYRTIFLQNIYHIGDTKSAQELDVFLRMPKERLRLGCGIQCTDALHLLGPRHRTKLHIAALRLLQFAIGIESAQIENEEQSASCSLLMAMYWQLSVRWFLPCVKAALALQSVVCLAQEKPARLLSCLQVYWCPCGC